MKKISWIMLIISLISVMALSACNDDPPPENIHTHAFNEWTARADSPCILERSCSCGESESRNVGADDPSLHAFKNGTCTNCSFSILELGYTHAIPESEGVQNVKDRAYLLTDVEWTPIEDVPGVDIVNKKYTVVPFKAGVTYKGIPYSGVTANDCYVGLNVSLESFLTALKNTNSVLYTENLFSTNPKSATYFGTVCSKFAQYALDLPGSYNSQNMHNIPDMATVAMPGEYTLDDIKLGDVIVNPTVHTTICTDILYDSDGKAAYVEISEATFPLCRRLYWSVDEFNKSFSTYRLCRYAHIDSAASVEKLDVKESYALMPRLGDKYNYKVSGKKHIVDILEDGYYKAVTKRNGITVNETVLNGKNSFTFEANEAGHIEMYLEKEDGTRSASVYANVVGSSVTVTDNTELGLGTLSVSFNGTSGTPLYVQVGSAHTVFCNIAGKTDTANISFPLHMVASLQVRVAYQNEYGIYLSEWNPFTRAKNPSNDPLLSQAEYWDGYTVTPNSPTPIVQETKTGYWTYTMIPVKENETYYSKGATRMWFLDSSGAKISTYNASKEAAVRYQFTTPARTAYITVSYSVTLVERGSESIQVVHNYLDGECLGCGAAEPVTASVPSKNDDFE